MLRRLVVAVVVLVVAVVLLVTLTLVACGDGEKTNGNDQAENATATATEEATNGCTNVDAPEPKPDGGAKKPTTTLAADKKWTATVETSCGAFTIRLDTKNSPKTASSFASLARQGFYDNTKFHRIVNGFVIQAGSPTGKGDGSPGYSVTEKPSSATRYLKGVVAMAKAGAEPAGTSGSQFFVVTGDDAALPPDYAVLGKITDGMDVVQRIGQLGDANEDPTQTVLIETVTIGS